MSTNHTTNYALNQWEGTDKVLRTEFNADNAKIDAALKANADAIAAEAAAREAAVTELTNRSRFTKLSEVNVSANTSRVEIDLSGVDWSQWDKVHLDYLFTDTIAMWVYLNVADEDIQFYSIGSNIPVGMYAPRLTLYVGFQENRQVWSNQNQKDDLMLPYSQLTKIIFSGSNMTPGTHFVLWGEK